MRGFINSQRDQVVFMRLVLLILFMFIWLSGSGCSQDRQEMSHPEHSIADIPGVHPDSFKSPVQPEETETRAGVSSAGAAPMEIMDMEKENVIAEEPEILVASRKQAIQSAQAVLQRCFPDRQLPAPMRISETRTQYIVVYPLLSKIEHNGAEKCTKITVYKAGHRIGIQLDADQHD
jgi:hypothetical protein